MDVILCGRPSEVLVKLGKVVGLIADKNTVVNFKIGRTNDIERRKDGYTEEYRPPPNDLIPIYKTTSSNNAIDVESVLIEVFYEHPKCLNEADDGRGNISDKWVQYVYVAVWMA